jgi:hypothetical protein
MDIRKHITVIAFAVFAMTLFIGCAPKYIDVNKALLEGKSVVIVPTYYAQDTETTWEKVDGKKRYIPLSKQPFADGSLLSNDYQVFIMDAGTYYIQNFSSSIYERDYKLKLPQSTANISKFQSAIDDIWVKKTPEREEDATGKRREVRSYYQMEYKFANNINDPKSIGTITINPHETVLIPSVWVDIEIADKACRFDDEKWLIFEILDVIATPSTLLYSNDEETWYWDCPIKSITVNIKTKPIDNDLLDEIALSPFSLKDFENLTVRDFEFGALLKQAKKIESLEDGTKRYIIDGSMDK